MARPLTHRVLAFKAVIEHITKDVPRSRGHVYDLKSIVEPLGHSITALVAMDATRDPTQTAAANDRRIINGAAKLKENREQTVVRLHSKLASLLRDIQGRIDQKVKLTPDGYAQEIRASLRAMSVPDRMRTLAQLAAGNNGPALAAMTEAPAMLTGLTVEQQKQFRDLIVETHAKAEKAEEAELLAAFSGCLSAADVAEALANDLSNPNRLADIERGVSAASAAEAAFNSPAQG